MNKLSPIYQISPVALIGEASETSIQVFCIQIHSLYFPQGQSTSLAHHTYWQLHVEELVNYVLGFENCFGRPVIKETNQKCLFVRCMCIKTTLEDFFFHLEYRPRAFVTLKILGILVSSSSNTLKYKKDRQKKRLSQIFICSAQVLITPMFHSPETTGNQGFGEKQTGDRDKSVHILCPVYKLSQS